MNKRTLYGLLTTTLPRYVAGFCVFFYVIIPLLVLCFPSIPAVLVFLNMVGWPAARFCNFKDPEKSFGLEGARNFYLSSSTGVTLGVWYIPPKQLDHTSSNNFLETKASSAGTISFGDRPIILYLHGNSAHRAAQHRVELYQLLAGMGYNVVTFDYRGYGDSTGSPSERGLVHDAQIVYKWIVDRCGSNKIFVWGHSLGTGVASHVTRKIFDEIDAGDSTLKEPEGVVLESPFSSLKDEVREHKFSKPFRWLPYFDFVFLGAFDRIDLHFRSDLHVRRIRSPILFLHADDDHVIPYHLCERLYEASKLLDNSEIRDGEERVQISKGVSKFAVTMALRGIKTPSSESVATTWDAVDHNIQPVLNGPADVGTMPAPKSSRALFRRQFVGFTGRAGYRHKWLVHAPEMETIIRDFVGA